MTEEEMADWYIQNDAVFVNNKATIKSVKLAFLAGLEVGRPKWHNVADGDLPKEEGSYLFYLYDKDTKSTFYEIFGVARRCIDRDDMYLESMIWTMNDIIAWCEIPKFEEVEE